MVDWSSDAKWSSIVHAYSLQSRVVVLERYLRLFRSIFSIIDRFDDKSMRS